MTFLNMNLFLFISIGLLANIDAKCGKGYKSKYVVGETKEYSLSYDDVNFGKTTR